MRVLLVSPNFYPKAGGIESHLFEVLKNVKDVEFTVLTNWRNDGGIHSQVFPNTGFVYSWPRDAELRKWAASTRATIRGYRLIVATIEVLRTLNRMGWLRRLDPDIVHFHYLNLDQIDRIAQRTGLSQLIPRWYTAISSVAKTRGPVLFTDHTVFTAPNEIVPARTRSALLECFSNIISVDRASYQVVRRYQEGHGGQSWFIPNSVDTERFAMAPETHRDFRIGYAARLGKLGQNIISSVAEVLGRDATWHFALAGELSDIADAQLRFVPPNSVFHSNLDYSNMHRFYNSVDVLLNPFPGEGVGRTTLEAMACGIPVVLVGSGDKYPIRPGATGFVLPPDPPSIASTIRTLREDSNLRRTIGTNARSLIVRDFSNSKLLPELRAVYKTLASS